jgi:hypothetical protein
MREYMMIEKNIREKEGEVRLITTVLELTEREVINHHHINKETYLEAAQYSSP